MRLLAFCGGIGAVAFVYTLNRLFSRGNGSPTATLILTGLIVSSFLTGLYTIIHFILEITSKTQVPTILFWSLGSLGAIRSGTIIPLLLFVSAGLVPLFLVRWQLNALSFSDEEARSMGVRVRLLQILLHVCVTLITASVVATCGGLGWVAVIIPHIARLMVGPNYKQLLPVTFCVGAIFLLLVDDICRSLLVQEIPLSILTTLIGAPYFIFMFVKNQKNGWMES